MLERDMELAVANCPDLFIEGGLTLVRRQVVINGRRPDLLFSDAFSRHLLVELQLGRLDEDHLQRHFYYFYDYRAKYPSSHPRLMFIANRLVPQHKDFLGDHGYEYREYPESEFAKRMRDCASRGLETASLRIENITPVEKHETSGILPASFQDILFDIETQRMTMCYKMLLLMFMCDLADDAGLLPLRILAERFQEFFLERSIRYKAEENPNIVGPNLLSARTVGQWEQVIRNQPARYLTERVVVNEGSSIRWAPRIWTSWDSDLKREIRDAAFRRLVNYFNRSVPGGF